MTETRVSRCGDCNYFIPVDVFKGICHFNKRSILTDEEPCAECIPVKKCKFCAWYTPKTDELGLCEGKVLTYPELRTSACEMFEWKSELATPHATE